MSLLFSQAFYTFIYISNNLFIYDIEYTEFYLTCLSNIARIASNLLVALTLSTMGSEKS